MNQNAGFKPQIFKNVPGVLPPHLRGGKGPPRTVSCLNLSFLTPNIFDSLPPLPPTDPRDVLRHAHRVAHKGGR